VNVPENLRRLPANPPSCAYLPGLLLGNRLNPQPKGRVLFADDWAVALEADRMGYRFQRRAKPLEFVEREQALRRAGGRSVKHRGWLLIPRLYPGARAGWSRLFCTAMRSREGVLHAGGDHSSADMDLIGSAAGITPVKFSRSIMEQATCGTCCTQEILGDVRAHLGLIPALRDQAACVLRRAAYDAIHVRSGVYLSSTATYHALAHLPITEPARLNVRKFRIPRPQLRTGWPEAGFPPQVKRRVLRVTRHHVTLLEKVRQLAEADLVS